MKKLIDTEITTDELSQWIRDKFRKHKITLVKFFGSRVNGKKKPRPDSDIDVVVLIKGKQINRGPIFSEIFKHSGKNYVIEFHAFEDLGDGWIPNHLLVEGSL